MEKMVGAIYQIYLKNNYKHHDKGKYCYKDEGPVVLKAPK